eukprot:6194480-Pleurochrysis_carterae.AAC.2
MPCVLFSERACVDVRACTLIGSSNAVLALLVCVRALNRSRDVSACEGVCVLALSHSRAHLGACVEPYSFRRARARQDTNALVMKVLPACLGVSKALKLEVGPNVRAFVCACASGRAVRACVCACVRSDKERSCKHKYKCFRRGVG